MKTQMKTIVSALVALVTMTAQADVTVKNVVAQQRWPWNGLVDIDYTVEADDPNADVFVYPVGFDNDRNISIAPRTLTGAGANGFVKPGTHRMTWDALKDEPDFNSSSFTVKMYAGTGMMLYMVVDLSNGPAENMFYPVRYTNTPPDINDDACRTTNMWLRLILPGTFMMGSPSMELGRGSDEDLRQVTITQPYYIGVFEVTQKQYELVTGENPSGYKGDTRPLESVSWEGIKGNFFGKLRSRTGIATCDLPTEAQWEYACRAGTSTALNSGKDLTATGTCPNAAEVGRYNNNRSDGKGGYSQHTKVGMYLPNVWGVYDMHGNVDEFCLETSGNYRIARGGGHGGAGAYEVRSARRYTGTYYWNSNSSVGFRVCVVPAP